MKVDWEHGRGATSHFKWFRAGFGVVGSTAEGGLALLGFELTVYVDAKWGFVVETETPWHWCRLAVRKAANGE